MSVTRAVLFKLATNEQFERAVKVVPGGERTAWRAASRYVGGRTQDEALATATDLLERGHGVSVDLFGELVTVASVADRVVNEYLKVIAALPPKQADAWISLDLTHLALDVDPAGAADRVTKIVEALPAGRRLQIGAEDATRTDAVLSCVVDVAHRGFADKLGGTVQANLLRSPADLDRLVDAGVHVRLVKGAYVEPAGVHPYGEATDVAYLTLAFRLAEQKAKWSMATHDGRIREALLLAFGLCRSSSFSGCARTRSRSCEIAASRPVCTFRSAAIGSGTGCGGSPNLAAHSSRWAFAESVVVAECAGVRGSVTSLQ